jgi:hypothetical protein
VHELTHVRQYEVVGARYAVEALTEQARKGRAAYDYGGIAGLVLAHRTARPLRRFGREAQASIVDRCYAELQANTWAPDTAEGRALSWFGQQAARGLF